MEGIKISTTKGAGTVYFYEPYILNKSTLGFQSTNIEGLHLSEGDVILNEREEGIEIKNNGKRYLIKVQKEDIEKFSKYRKQEAKKVNEFFKRLASDKEIVRVYIGDMLIKTETQLGIGYTPYYDKVVRFLIEKNTKGLIKDTTEDEFQKQLGRILNQKLDFSKFKIIKESDGEYIKTTFTTLCEYIMA